MLHGWTLTEGWWVAADGTRLRAISGGGSGGGGKTTVQTIVPPKTAEELELIRKQNTILDIQIGELKRQNEALERIFPEQEKLLRAQTRFAIEAAEFQREQIPIARRAGELQEQLTLKAIAELEGTPEEREIKKLSTERSLAFLRGEAPPLLPGQQERINIVFGRAKEEAQTALRSFGEELATSRGLRVTDTPIGGELLRQGAEVASKLAATKAATELDVGSAERQFTMAVAEFQARLREQAFQNRLALTGFGGPRSAAAGALPIFAGTTTQGAMGGAQGLLNTLSAERLGSATQTTRLPGVDFSAAGAGVGALGGAASGAYVGSFAGPWGTAIGALLGGALGAYGGGSRGSSITLKKAILPYDPDEYDRALEKIRGTPIARWKYKWEPDSTRSHTGPILEMAPEDIREDDLHINLLSYSGLLHASVKALDRKVDRFGQQLAALAKVA